MANKKGDDYAAPVYKWMARLDEGPPVNVKPDWMKGESANHLEQRAAGWAGQNLASVRELILDWYGPQLERTGDQGRARSSEALFSYSHFAHYLAARWPILYFALRAGDREVVDCMVRVHKGMLAAARLVTVPSGPKKGMLVCPCARFSGADQRQETSRTFAYLEGRKVKMPKTLATAPSWLGLFVLTELDRLYDNAAAENWWVFPWKQVRLDIRSATLNNLLPLLNQLVVEQSKTGHLAYFTKTTGMGGDARAWAWVDYRDGEERYGVDAGGLMPSHEGPTKVTQFPVAGKSRAKGEDIAAKR